MKKMYLMSGMLFCSIGSLSSQLMSEEILLENVMQEDSTVKHYERKVLLQLTDIGLSTRKFSLPVVYCPHNAKKCHKKGHWTYTIDQSLENQMSTDLLKKLSGKRYDTLKLMKDKISIQTIFENIEVESKIKSFQYDVGSASDFNQSVEKYLNKHVAPLMLRLLGKAKDARYQEMADKEKETFLATIAKEESVPATFIKSLMSSAYVFSLYLNDMSGSVDIDQQERTDFKGSKYLVFDTEVEVKTNISLVIFNFNPDTNQFSLYSSIKAVSGKMDSSTDHKHYPKFNQTVNNFNSAVSKASKDSGRNANIVLKDDDNFAIFATVDSLDGNKISSHIGELEDLRIDAPYNLYQQINGERTKVGWSKARSVASEQTYKEDNGNYNSDFDLISGNAEIQDSMREHPWSGIFFYIGVANSTISLEEFDNVSATGGGNYTGLNLGSKLDLGYAFNSAAFSEKWLELDFSVGVGGDDLVVTRNSFQNTYSSSLSGSATLDIVQRKHLGASGVYVAYKYGIGAVALLGTSDSDETLTVLGFGPNFGVQAGFQTSADRTYYITVDAFIPVVANAKTKLDSVEADFDAALSPVVVKATIGATFHVRP